MKKLIFTFLAIISAFATASAQVDSMKMFMDSLEARFNYQTGDVVFESGIGTLKVPDGFRYLDGPQGRYVLEELWGNPADSSVMGMIVPTTSGLLGTGSWAFIITYEAMGYVKDDDADDIDYDDLLKEMKDDIATENETRKSMGYETVDIVGWASKPYYDSDKKVLHWAKEIKFGESPVNTLNYNVRILGRKGVLVLNAVSSMNELEEVKKNINPVLSSFTYAEGTKYDDFDPELDEVAAWTIGGLVAGKVLAKVGFFAIFLKYIKLIGVAVVALFGGIWKWYKKKTEAPTVRNIEES